MHNSKSVNSMFLTIKKCFKMLKTLSLLILNYALNEQMFCSNLKCYGPVQYYCTIQKYSACTYNTPTAWGNEGVSTRKRGGHFNFWHPTKN